MTTREEISTSGIHSQFKFDKLISDTDISGLTYLGSIYSERLKEYKMTHDLNNPDFLDEFQSMKQRKKMINEELSNRMQLIKDSRTYTKDVHFNDNYDVVIDDNDKIRMYRPSLTERGNIEIIEIEEEDVRD